MENSAGCNEGLSIGPGEVKVQFITLLHRFYRTQGHVWRGTDGSNDLKCRLDFAAWVLLGEINSMENCAGYNEGLARGSGEVELRLIGLFCLFDPTRRAPFGEDQPGPVT
jgi:hypothetical protein